MAKLTIELRPDERQALQKAAINDRRDPRDQVVVIVVRELERTGYLAAAPAIKAAGLTHEAADGPA